MSGGCDGHRHRDLETSVPETDRDRHRGARRGGARWARLRSRLREPARDAPFVERDANGKLINQTTGIFALGGATNDNEENYLIAKVNRMMGVVRIENQARI